MDDVLPQLDPVQIKAQKRFISAIAVSILLHIVSAYFLLFHFSGAPSRSASVTYIDLKSFQQAAPTPMTVPERKAPPAEIPPQPAKQAAPETQPEVQRAAVPPAPSATVQEPVKAEEDLPHNTLGLGLTKGYFKSLGDGETLRAGIKSYYLAMLQGINEKWWLDQQLDKRSFAPMVVNITIARNGEIIGSQILRSSGSRRFDKAVLAALTTASPLPPLPEGFQGDTFEAPVRLVPPLNLMSW